MQVIYDIYSIGFILAIGFHLDEIIAPESVEEPFVAILKSIFWFISLPLSFIR